MKPITITLPSQRRPFVFDSMDTATQWLPAVGKFEKSMEHHRQQRQRCSCTTCVEHLKPGTLKVLNQAYNFRLEFGDNYIPLQFMRWVHRAERDLKMTQSSPLVVTRKSPAQAVVKPITKVKSKN